MAKELLQHFLDLFQSSNPNREDMCSTLPWINKKLSKQAHQMLEKEFQDEEIKEAIFAMGPLKASEPDGYQARFYKKILGYCGERGDGICDVYLTKYNTSVGN